MQSKLPASPAPPSPVAPIEPGPHDPTAVFGSTTTTHAQPLLEEPFTSGSSSGAGGSFKKDLERAILIECTELYVLVAEGDWQGVTTLGLAMDLKASPLSVFSTLIRVFGLTLT
jgi:hypothetical protein